MAEKAKGMPEHGVLTSIPCVTDGTAARIIAEIGSVERFASSKALVAYIGIDPMVLQSGKQSGEHLHITKKGSGELRTMLYLVVLNMTMRTPDCKIAVYVSKKKKDGLSHKAALIAGVNKLVRTMFAMLVNGTEYSED